MIPAANAPIHPKPDQPTPLQPARWQQGWRDAVRDPRELLSLLGLEALAAHVSAQANAQFPLRVPRGFVARMRHGDAQDPLLRQVLPLDEEMRVVPGFSLDAVGDENHQYLYHPKNTMCAIFTKAQLPTTVFDEMEIPQKIFELKIDSKTF